MKKHFYILQSFLILFLIFFPPQQIVLAQSPSNGIKIYSNIRYNPVDGQPDSTGGIQPNAHLLDIYQPEGCFSCPVVVYIHGGTWIQGDKGPFNERVEAFTSQQYIYVSINYRLSPGYEFPAHAQDVASAFYWIKKHIQNYGGDPEQIFLLGHSAGGHLAALIALQERYLDPFDLKPSDITGIIGLDSAAYHLPSLFYAEPENQLFFEMAFGNNLLDWAKASPVNYVRPGLNLPPFLFLVAGGRGVSETVNQDFYQKLINQGYQAKIVQFPEKDHVSIDQDLGKAEDVVFPVVLQWLERLSR